MKVILVALSVVGLASCGGGSSSSSNDSEPGRSVPDDVPPLVRQQYLSYAAPPAGYAVFVPWLTAIHDERSLASSQIEIDYLRGYCQNSTGSRLVSSYEYNDTQVEGGLWQRRPQWFESGYIGPLPRTLNVAAGTISIAPSSGPSAAWHLWGPRGDVASLVPGATKCWVEARVRITGYALIQGGADYYVSMTSSTPREAGVTNWLFPSPAWQEIIFAR